MNSDSSTFPLASDAPARCYALIACAGSGSRAGTVQPKQYQWLAGARVVDHSVNALLAVPELVGVGVVVAPHDSSYRSPHARVQVWPVGGATRAHSVYQGLLAWQAAGARLQDWVLVHDAARCLVQPEQVQALIRACDNDAVGGLLALPVPDTLKQANAQGRAGQTLDRTDVWQAQTPQMFRLGVLLAAMQVQADSGFAGITDEASAIELQGHTPLLVRGGGQNFKVTYPEDFALAEAVLAARNMQTQPQPAPQGHAPALPAWRVGEGWDVHALVPGRELWLGGVRIAHHSGLLGHSDADALLHAITDALLGAAAEGDIGTWFPDSDVRFQGADSAVLLAEAARGVAALGYRIANVDATVVAQAPRLGAYKAAMRSRIAQVLGLEVGQVNVKAKTAEKLGPVGQGLSIEARAVVLMLRG